MFESRIFGFLKLYADSIHILFSIDVTDQSEDTDDFVDKVQIILFC